MILTYSFRQFPELILQGTKIHTIREDKNSRWKPGRSIQHWMHNPRNVSKNPFHFKDSEVISIQNIYIEMPETDTRKIFIDGRVLTTKEIETLAVNDGFFNTIDFWNYFNKDFKGIIIHWTNFKY